MHQWIVGIVFKQFKILVIPCWVTLYISRMMTCSDYENLSGHSASPSPYEGNVLHSIRDGYTLFLINDGGLFPYHWILSYIKAIIILIFI